MTKAVLPSKAREAYLVCKSNARCDFLALDGSVVMAKAVYVPARALSTSYI